MKKIARQKDSTVKNAQMEIKELSHQLLLQLSFTKLKENFSDAEIYVVWLISHFLPQTMQFCFTNINYIILEKC